MIKKNKTPNYRKKSEEVLFQRKVRHFSGKIFKICQFLMFISIISLVVWYNEFEGNKLVEAELNNTIEEAFLAAGLEIKEIEIEGNSAVTNEQIISAIFNNVELYNRLPTMFIDLDDVTAEIHKIGWVKEVHLKKKLPQTLLVNIIERVPAVLWKNNEEVWLTDSKGHKITQNIEPVYFTLPYIVGAETDEDVKNAFDILRADEDLLLKVTAIRKIGNRRWNVELQNGVNVSLPEKEPAKAWAKLAEINLKKSLLSKEVEYIDLRIEGQITAGLYGKNNRNNMLN